MIGITRGLRAVFMAAFALAALPVPSAWAGQSIFKQRGPLDSFRQFTAHFEFPVPKNIGTVRSCVLDEVKRVAKNAGEAEPVFKVKNAKKKGANSEKYSWSVKRTSEFSGSYTAKYEISFSFGDGWTNVDTDMVYGDIKQLDGQEIYSDGLVTLHQKCGLAEAQQAIPEAMPRVLGYESGEDEARYSAMSEKSVEAIFQCLNVRSEDIGSAYLSNTYQADHFGAFYLYYIQSFKNLGATQRLPYVLKITPVSTGSRLDILVPGASLENISLDQMEKSLFPAMKIKSCGGVRTVG